MSTRKIEQLDEQTILGDNDLMFMSKSNGNGFDSKKVTLASIANYVRSGMEVVPSRSGMFGYTIYDTDYTGYIIPGSGEDGSQYNGYMGDSSWVSPPNNVASNIDHICERDCTLIVKVKKPEIHANSYNPFNPSMTINGKSIALKTFPGTIEWENTNDGNQFYMIDIKQG